MPVPNPAGAPHPRAVIFRKDVDLELVRYLYRQAPSSILVLLTVGAIMAYVLWDLVAHDAMLAWLGLLAVVSAVRFAQIAAFRWRAPTKENSHRWAVLSAAGSSLVGGTWALACFLFLDPAHPMSLITLTVILMGMSAGSVVNLASYLPSFAGVVGPSMGALVGLLFWYGDTASTTVAVLAAIASLAYIVGARNVHKLLKASLELGFENLALRRDAEEKTTLLEATLHNMGQGISLSDPEGRLRMWNPQFLDLLGLSQLQLAEGDRLEAVLKTARPPIDAGDASRSEYRREDGAVVEIAQNAMPDGGRVVTYADITDLKTRETALETAKRTAEQANAAKTRFLASASHDLRQPIHALGLLFGSLAERVRDEEARRLLVPIDNAIEAVDSMLNSLLDISKLDAGVMQPHLQAVDLAALLARLDGTFQPLAQSSGNRLRVRPSEVAVKTDPAMLQRILDNLIANALRYTRDGRVLVGVRRLGGAVRIDVCDSGIGIPAASLEEVFVEFHQLGNPERDQKQGLGLGLAIVKRLCTLLGHALAVKSVPGRGSRFSVTLPLAGERPASTELPATPFELGLELQGRRVLVLDDDAAVRVAMRSMLERWGCEVSTAASHEEAEALFTQPGRLPELLIVDYRLRQHASGIESVARLHALCGHAVPALVITGDTAPERLREAQRSGYPLLHKPVKPAKLRTAMRQLLQPPGEPSWK